MGDDPRANGIEYHVPNQLKKMPLLFHEDRLESALKDMADPFVSTVEALCVDAVQKVHSPGESGLWRFEKKVIVISHENERMEAPARALDGLPQNSEKFATVSVIAEDGHPRVAATCDMPNGAGVLESQWTSHALS